MFPRPWGHPAQDRSVERLTQPVKALGDAPDESLVRVLLQSRLLEQAVHRRNCAFELPARAGEYQQVIHKAQVTGGFATCQLPVQLIQMKPRQQRAQRTPPWNAAPGLMKVAAVLHAVVQELPEQVQRHRATDMLTEQVKQLLLVDVGVVTANLGFADELIGICRVISLACVIPCFSQLCAD